MADHYDDEGRRIDVAELGEIRLCARMCDTCVFRPGNLMHLEPGRVTDMVKAAHKDEGHITCHKTLDTEAPAICRGYADKADRGRSLALRIGRALGWLREVEPHGKDHE
jgi:hypothetical protein